jgi:predicted Zn-dependent peptidase
VYFATEPEHREWCLRLVNDELRRLSETELTPSALHRALNQIRGQMAVSADNSENAALAMAKQVLHTGRATTWEESLAVMETFRPAELRATAEEIFAPESVSVLQYL